MAILLFCMWILLSGQVSIWICASGAVVSGTLYWFSCRVLGYSGTFERKALRKLGKGVRYVVYLVWEMLKAGFVVMRLIYTKGRRMEPRLIWFSTELETQEARAALANAITLTAGTITVSQEDGRMCVHTLDRSLAEGLEHSAFEARLLELEK